MYGSNVHELGWEGGKLQGRGLEESSNNNSENSTEFEGTIFPDGSSITLNPPPVLFTAAAASTTNNTQRTQNSSATTAAKPKPWRGRIQRWMIML